MSKNKEMKSSSLAEMKDKYIGTIGTTERDEYEYELRMDVLGRMIKTASEKALRLLKNLELLQLILLLLATHLAQE